MRALTAIVIIVYNFKLGATASADGESCTTSASCATGSTCYRGLCTRGLNGLPCNSSSNCFGTATCTKSDDFDPICFRPDRCDTSQDCFIHETCLTQFNLCSAGAQNMPCSSAKECLPSFECRDSICQEVTRGENIETNPLDCMVNTQSSIPELKVIELPSWLVGALGLAVGIVAAQAPQWIMKPEATHRRKTVFYAFLGTIIVIWIAYFTVAVIDQVMQQRIVSHSEVVSQAAADCFPTDSIIFRLLQDESGQVSKLFHVVTAGFFLNVVASIIFSLAVLLLIWRYLREYDHRSLVVEWKKVIPVGLFVAAIGLTAIFVGGKIANEKATFLNPYCEIVTANEQEYVTCALSEENNAGLESFSFRNETVNICSEMARQSIQRGNVSEGSPEKITAAAGEFTDSQAILSEVLIYQAVSVILGGFYFGFSNVNNLSVLHAWLAFVFLKVVFQLLLSMLLVKLVFKRRPVSAFVVSVAILLVMAEVGVKITGFLFKASIKLKIESIDVVSACGFLLPGFSPNGVLNRSFSPGAGDILKAGMTFLFAVIGFKELFTSGQVAEMEEMEEMEEIEQEEMYPPEG